MKDIAQLYYNNFGVTFYWRKDGKVLDNRVQIVFRETGFYLTQMQLSEFLSIIKECADSRCACCSMKSRCHRFLLKTPVPEVDIAVNQSEYEQIKDLVEGTLFNISMRDYAYRISLN